MTGATTGERSRGVLLVADRVVTLGHGRYRAGGVLVRGSRVVWVGDDPDQAPPHGARVDLSGCTLGPAFVDSHAHLTPTGLSLTGLDLTGVRSGAELLAAVRTFAQQHTGRIVWGHGFDPHTFDDELPGPDDLARASGGLPVYLSRIDGHSALVDRGTLASAPLARVSGIDRDSSGQPTGVLRLEANHIVRRWSVGAMGEQELERARAAAARHAASLGIASVHEMGGPDLFGAADFDAWCVGDWPVEIVGYWGDMDLGFVAERDLKQVGGDLLLDGSLGSHTAALTEPYADRATTGHLEFDDDTLIEFFRAATHAGIQVGVHAIGDGAIRQAVRCWRAVESSLPDYVGEGIRRLRHRIEHAEVIPPDLIGAIAELGLVVSTQPAFEATWGGPGGMYETRLGARRAAWSNPYRALADRGVPLAFGSDASSTPMDPWGGVHAAQHRRRPEHAISRLEAVSASALGGRYAARQDRYVGVVRAGMRADLAAWEGDPFRDDDPRGARCVLTVLRGLRTHGDSDALPDRRAGAERQRSDATA